MNRMADLHNKDADDLKKPVRTFLRLFIFYVDILDGNVLLSSTLVITIFFSNILTFVTLNRFFYISCRKVLILINN